MNCCCELQALVVSSDSVVVDSIASCLAELGITISVHKETSSAITMLSRQKTDVFFVDRELDPEFAVLKGMRSSPSSRGAVAFAIVPRSGSTGGAFRVANFVIDKPLARSRVSRAVRAAYGLMLKERMRYFRHPIDAPATLVDSTHRKFLAHISNISQTGLALECAGALMAGEEIQLQFCLPGDEQSLSCKAQIIWTADKAKMGMTYRQISGGHKARLMDWLESKFIRQWGPAISNPIRSTHATA